MEIIPTREFCFEKTIKSGQPINFTARFYDKTRIAFAGDNGHVSIEYQGDVKKGSIKIEAEKRVGTKVKEEVTRRLGLSDNMIYIYKKIDTDNFMHKVIKTSRGLRITWSEPWEAMVSFILSQHNNIRNIRNSVQNIIEKFGESVDNSDIKKFPTIDAIAEAKIEEIKSCKTGFRAAYLKDAAIYCRDNIKLDKLYGMNYSKAKERLMEIKGIGDKVADCILLMGYKKTEAFPIDIWVKRTLEEAYFGNEKKEIKSLHEFAEDKWGKYSGYAQAYIFYYSITKMKNNKNSKG
ncbi:MAG: DNA-3-methyladenine glycosylase family protein [Candidatus Micrarchaeia archaeon]